MLEWLPIIASLVVTGLIAGTLAGLLGVGGGIVIVPVLVLVFDALGISSSTSMSVAAGTSLLVILATSLSSTKAHYKKGNVDYALLRFWCPFIVLGSMAGAGLSISIGGKFASFVFGIVAISVAFQMFFKAGNSAIWSSMPAKIFQVVLACVTGAVSVVMGIGGGTLGVPILASFNYSVHKAVGTCAAFGFLIAVPGIIMMLLLAKTPVDAPPGTVGFVNLIGAAFIMPLSVLMAPIGVRLGTKLKASSLQRVFALFLIFSGVRMVFQAISGFDW